MNGAARGVRVDFKSPLSPAINSIAGEKLQIRAGAAALD
jgi:hypothetical protein